MNPTQDMGSLKHRWQAQATPGPDVAALRKRVGIDTRQSRYALLLAGLGSLLIVAMTLAYAWRSARTAAWISFALTAGFVALVWLAALYLSRGTWRPRDESTAAYLEVSIRRCRSVILAAPIGILLYVAGLIGSLAWKQRVLGVEWSQLLESPPMILAGWIGAPLYAAGMAWNALRQRQRLTLLLNLKRQLSSG